METAQQAASGTRQTSRVTAGFTKRTPRWYDQGKVTKQQRHNAYYWALFALRSFAKAMRADASKRPSHSAGNWHFAHASGVLSGLKNTGLLTKEVHARLDARLDRIFKAKISRGVPA